MFTLANLAAANAIMVCITVCKVDQQACCCLEVDDVLLETPTALQRQQLSYLHLTIVTLKTLTSQSKDRCS